MPGLIHCRHANVKQNEEHAVVRGLRNLAKSPRTFRAHSTVFASNSQGQEHAFTHLYIPGSSKSRECIKHHSNVSQDSAEKDDPCRNGKRVRTGPANLALIKDMLNDQAQTKWNKQICSQIREKPEVQKVKKKLTSLGLEPRIS